MPVKEDGIPAELRMVDRWLCWSWSWNGKKWDKPPLNASTGRNASSTDPSTWTTFSVAHAAHKRGDFDGIGFVLGEDRPTHVVFSGFDLDNCINDEDEIDIGASFLASCLDSYAELSPSGLGVKVFCLGSLPPKHRCTEKDLPFEIYDGGRYFTVTGHHLPWSPSTVNERTAELARLYDRLFPARSLNGRERSDRDKAIAALSGLDPRRASAYRDWLLVGLALHSVSSDLLNEWDSWSRKCPEKYTEGICAKKWESFKKSGVGLGSLIHWAREDGWVERRTATIYVPPSKPYIEEGRVEDGPQDDDPHMGDGLTEEDGAGVWELRIENGDPVRYWLRSPIWVNSPRLEDGFLLLTKLQIFSWRLIRQEALDQASVPTRPDRKKRPVWDGATGQRLLQRLIRNASRVMSSTEYDRILVSAEFILDLGRTAMVLTEDAKSLIDIRPIFREEDGSLVFKLRLVAAEAKRKAPGISIESLREAVSKYGGEYRVHHAGKRLRFSRFSVQQIEKIEQIISQKSEEKQSKTDLGVPRKNDGKRSEQTQ